MLICLFFFFFFRENDVFVERDEFPFSKMLTLYRQEPFQLTACYAFPNLIPHLSREIGLSAHYCFLTGYCYFFRSVLVLRLLFSDKIIDGRFEGEVFCLLLFRWNGQQRKGMEKCM